MISHPGRNRILILLIFCEAVLLIGLMGDGMEPKNKTSEEISIVSVRVRREDSDAWTASGSGVVWQVEEHDLWIVTAGHVLSGAGGKSRVYVEFGEDVAECLWYEVTEEVDLAFLRIDGEALPERLKTKLAAAVTDKESYDGLRASDAVWVSGFREGSLVRYDGVLEDPWIYVEDFEQYMMLAECEIAQGMSGGGLYDGAGNLIGIVCGAGEEGELAAVPLHVAQACFVAVESGGVM